MACETDQHLDSHRAIFFATCRSIAVFPYFYLFNMHKIFTLWMAVIVDTKADGSLPDCTGISCFQSWYVNNNAVAAKLH